MHDIITNVRFILALLTTLLIGGVVFYNSRHAAKEGEIAAWVAIKAVLLAVMAFLVWQIFENWRLNG